VPPTTGGAEVLVHHPSPRRCGSDDHLAADEEHAEPCPALPRPRAHHHPQEPQLRERPGCRQETARQRLSTQGDERKDKEKTGGSGGGGGGSQDGRMNEYMAKQ
jgi:hypothetical protein